MKIEFAEATILIVDDQRQNVVLLEKLLRRAGYPHVHSTTDPREAVELAAQTLPDLVLLDLHMPHLDGFEVMERLRPLIPPADYLPILVLTADATAAAKQHALSVGASDFLPKPFDHVEVLLRMENLLRIRSLHREVLLQNDVLEEKVRHRTSELWTAVQRLEETQDELRISREETINRLSTAAEYRDEETALHVQRMSRYCELLAVRLGVDPERADVIRVASQMHDVGKIGIPDRILLKPGRLTPEEYRTMREHAVIGHRILSGTRSELGEAGASIAWTHHERVDGTGYPRGLVADEIPFEGRVAAIADVFDALTSDRVYRKAFGLMEATRMLREGRGTHFDAEMLDAFFDVLDDVLRVKEALDESDPRTQQRSAGSFPGTSRTRTRLAPRAKTA
ncbi:MAG: response regulator [Actinomycetota bacterium]|nr:response regulator [Actinomycetota bacterium]